MEMLIPVINRLQDVLVSVGISTSVDLPQIAVVGAQSVGKSSVLEALVGKDFLPRGVGIVTRRPVILQLRNVNVRLEKEGVWSCKSSCGPSSLSPREFSEKSEEMLEYGEFSHSPGVKVYDFNAIRREIERETERVSGRNKNISAHPIILKVFSSRVIDLTLIDLPGITKVPVGDQPTDIELQVRRIIFQYISKPNCIILAVTAANTDLANSDSLKIAREVDPEGVRTVGVITKCDTLEGDGTNAMDMLCGKIYPLKRGYVGVVCRSQRNIQDKKSIEDSLKDEEKFFRTHPSYRNIASKCGIKYLSTTLNHILMYHIRDAIPELRNRLLVIYQDTEAELIGCGDPILESKGNPGALLLHFFSKFARNFQDAIDGKLPAYTTTTSSSSTFPNSFFFPLAPTANSILSTQLTGGARINYIFHDWFSRHIYEFDPLEGLSDNEIRTAIRNATGPKAALFVPEGAFEILVKKQIQLLESPALQCVEQVYEELQKIVEKCELPEMSRFTSLRDRIMGVMKGVLKKCLAPTNQMVHNIIQIELAYINTNHVDFMNNQNFPNVLCATTEKIDVNSSAHRRNNNLCFSSSPSISAHINSLSSAEARRSCTAPVCLSSNINHITLNNSKSNNDSIEKAPQNALGPLQNNQTLNTAQPDLGNQHIFQHGGFFSFFKGNRTPPRPDFIVSSASISNLSNTSSSVSSYSSGLANNQNSYILRNVSSASRSNLSYVLPRNNSSLSSSTNVNVSCYVNSFNTNTLRLPDVPAIVAPSNIPSDREIIETDLIKSLIWSYFNIVRKNVTDAIPKSIMYFMVNTAKDVIQRELVSQLYREELFAELLKEADDVSERRIQCKEMLKTLKNSMEILAQIRDFTTDD